MTLFNTISSKFQITLSKEIREYLNVGQGDILKVEPGRDNSENVGILRVAEKIKSKNFESEECFGKDPAVISTPDVKVTCFLPYPPPSSEPYDAHKGRKQGSMNLELRRLVKDDYIPDITFEHEEIMEFFDNFIVTESKNGYIVQLASMRLKVTDDEMEQIRYIIGRLRPKYEAACQIVDE